MKGSLYRKIEKIENLKKLETLFYYHTDFIIIQ